MDHLILSTGPTGPSSRSQWIAYVGPFPFPDGTSSARRVLGVARAIAASGIGVRVAAGYLPINHVHQLGSDGLDAVITYEGLGEYTQRLSRFGKAVRLFWSGGASMLNWLESQESRPLAVVAYGTLLSHWRRLLSWCRKRGVPLIGDIVDWYSVDQMPGGLINYWANDYTLRSQVPHSQGVIGISSYLCNYYQRRGLRTLRIPPIVDTRNFQCASAPQNTPRVINLVYAGVPTNKDLLGNVFEGLRTCPNAMAVRLHLVGPEADHVRKVWPDYPAQAVTLYGRLKHAEAVEIVHKADFSVLFRPNQRYAQAGFPTKAVESLASGTPVIGNLTSDLGEYLKDSRNAFICEDESAEAFTGAVRRAWEARHRWPEMRQEARRTAERSFDFRQYSESMLLFLRASWKQPRRGNEP